MVLIPEMKLLVVEGIMSAVYIFDVSAYPFVHVPFYLLTLMYFGSILEIAGLYGLGRYLSRRFPWLRRQHNAKRSLDLPFSAPRLMP